MCSWVHEFIPHPVHWPLWAGSLDCIIEVSTNFVYGVASLGRLAITATVRSPYTCAGACERARVHCAHSRCMRLRTGRVHSFDLVVTHLVHHELLTYLVLAAAEVLIVHVGLPLHHILWVD